ncbi:MAG: Gfo/Idh/MocA family oxidoreductase [Candidatus Omnitrophica bacterium]|nr:Gfo/Idh/MocA family oxidoreductase [Candidatus Omnitrophota bacterium]
MSEKTNYSHSQPTSRRQFLKTSGTVVVGGALASQLSFPAITSAAGNGTLRLGLIGCGGRGTGAAEQALHADGDVILTAMADVFENRLQTSLGALKGNKTVSPKSNQPLSDQVKVDPDHCFIGLDAYRKVLDSDVDVVILATPPGFRPLHLKASVDAGKHIFCEKPMATDAPGVRSVLATVDESKKKDIALVAGFCWRYDYARRAIFERIHDGDVGDIRAIYATYYTGPVRPMPSLSERKPDMTELEWQLLNWYNFVWLCGDSLVEQAVHSVDKMAWAMKDVPPLKAVAVGGRQIPNPGGNIYDHFEVNYEYANGVRGFMGSRQQANCYNQNADYIIGTKGTGLIGVRGGAPEIVGEQNWKYDGPGNNMYQTEHDEFFASIRNGKHINDGVRMIHSTMMAIMGRMAAYTGEEISWDQALNSQENLMPADLSWDMKLEAAPMAMPGVTRFI